jgi:hypothetical protein
VQGWEKIGLALQISRRTAQICVPARKYYADLDWLLGHLTDLEVMLVHVHLEEYMRQGVAIGSAASISGLLFLACGLLPCKIGR